MTYALDCETHILTLISCLRLRRSLCLSHSLTHVSCPGQGDMAVSNSLGSNVFDILIGLGVPWSIQTLAVSLGSQVRGRHVELLIMLSPLKPL